MTLLNLVQQLHDRGTIIISILQKRTSLASRVPKIMQAHRYQARSVCSKSQVLSHMAILLPEEGQEGSGVAEVADRNENGAPLPRLPSSLQA